LSHEGILSTLAEMHIAVVGFSLVVGILRPQSQTEERRLFTLRGVAIIGLLGAVMSAFPMVAHSFGLSPESTWRLSSVVVFLWAVAAIGADFWRLGHGLTVIAKRYRLTTALVAILIAANLCLLVFNVATPGPASGARYSAVMLIALAQAGFMFLWAAFDAAREEPAAQQGAAADEPQRVPIDLG